ncbi:MAG: FdtA/QdtA family cupin domain-containing protein [Anaerolineaceae bacterium]|nr:FdtA/QdtA family cupin domain-containing protein [Anaerolineaceae bacterium]
MRDEKPSRTVCSKVSVDQLEVKGVRLYHLPYYPDSRGDLTVGELGCGLPFIPRRYFVVYSVPGPENRGDHAHLECEQFLLCLKGQCRVLVDDGSKKQDILLDDPTLGLYIPPMVWAMEHHYSSDAVLLVLASEIYKPEDYIRDYDAYLRRVRERENTIS